MKTAFVSVVASLIVTTGSVAFAQEAARQQLPQRATAIQMVPVTQPAVRAVQAQHVRPVAPARRLQGTQAGRAAGPAILNGVGTPGQPDLVIEPWRNGTGGLPNSGYCGPWNGGNMAVKFYVVNKGNALAGPTVAQVNFGGTNYGTVPVPAIAPNAKRLITSQIPLAAWGPNQYHASVNFLIAADHNDALNETDVTNNYGQGKCMGPAT
ncbi:CARDB domain-containing protein [Kiloniella sp. b19]|uniref:CARDB domain-containing protein n=1 Tax=Kiloniella sp. GXU_MW_B19 TaxID=3141326 RepID=UPI0031CEF878